ncbi:unnamed protein product [Auanema sp. JU1783]|nr:unnamed protein product [Auanema sp. JU1783]
MRPLERFFHGYGKLVARHPWPFIIVPVILTIISSYGYKYFHSQDDIWDIYAPTNGRSRVEEAGLKPFEYASGSHHHRMQIIVTKKNGGNLLQSYLLKEMEEAHKYVTENITLFNGIREFEYKEVCGAYCNESNGAVLAFLQAFTTPEHSPSIKLTFPNAEALQRKIFIGYSIGNLTFKNGNPDEEVKEIRMVLLHYMVDTNIMNGKDMALDYEMKLRKVFDALTEASPELNYQFLSRVRELEEQRNITIMAVPFLSLTILVLTCFMLITLIDFPLYRSQHLESLIGVISPMMALWTSAGFLFWLGFPFSNILTVVPFLVITIGIDDAFLILAGWRQSTKGASLEERLGESVAISGASVTVTSVTDVLCFAIGLFSNMPVVQLFCLYTTVSLFVDFFYQMTIFTAIVGIISKRQLAKDEEKVDHSSFERIKAKLKETTGISSFSLGSTSDKSYLEEFVSHLHTRPIQLLILGIFFTHIGVGSYFAAQVNTDFDMENLYLHDSPLTDISRRMQDFLLREAFVVNFAVQPIPDFSDEILREEFEEMLVKLESIPKYGGGSDRTNVWTRDFGNAVAFWGDEENFWEETELLKNYREYGMEEKYINTKNTSRGEVIDGFYFSMTYHNMSSFLEVEDMMYKRRDILASYPQFHILSHHPFEKVPTESAASAPSNFYQTVVAAVTLMSLLVLLFVLNVEAIISVVISIISICIGVVAYLHLWSVHLDAVSLISILMSIGFSVDYSAHVCYHYFAHAAEEEKEHGKANTATIESQSTSTESTDSSQKSDTSSSSSTYFRILVTLRGVGWPVVQSGLSTIIGMFPLMFIQAYVVAVFWKTVILVGILGMFHALLLLPVIFILTNDLKRAIISLYRGH